MAMIQGQAAGTCAEGDGCPRWTCRLCKTYWLGHMWHECDSTVKVTRPNDTDTLERYFDDRPGAA